MAEPSRAAQPPGVSATIVGALSGTTAVHLVGPPIANAVAADGLAGLGTALLVLFAMWCLGTGLGVGIALAIRGSPTLARHRDPRHSWHVDLRDGHDIRRPSPPIRPGAVATTPRNVCDDPVAARVIAMVSNVPETSGE